MLERPSRRRVAGRRDPFAPLLENPLAALLPRARRAPARRPHAVPTGGAPQPVTLYDDGRERINLGSNNYLGLAGDPRVIEAAADALRQFGTSTSGSRVLNGTTRAAPRAGGGAGRPLRHRGRRAHLLGHQRQRRAAVDRRQPRRRPAGRRARARQRARRRRGQPGHGLRGSGTTTWARCASGWSGSTPRAGAVVVVDGVYSMTGETGAAGRDRRRSATAFGARLVVDEAHGLGVLGERGRGAAEKEGVLDRVDAVTVAFSKSLASVGGAVMTSRAAADGIRASAMPYVFSAANDPASVGAALAALRILRNEPERMARHQRERRAAAPGAHRGRHAAAPGRGAVIAVPTGHEDGDRPPPGGWPSTRASTSTPSPTRGPARTRCAAAVGHGHPHRRAAAAGRRDRRRPPCRRRRAGAATPPRLTAGRPRRG